MKKLALVIALCSLAAMVPAGAGQVCWYQEVSGAVCAYDTPASAHVRTQTSNVSVWGDGLAVTGVAIEYKTPPGVRLWINGQQFTAGGIPTVPGGGSFSVCWHTGLAPAVCQPVAGVPFAGVLNVRTTPNHVSVDGTVAGVPIPYTGAVVTFNGKLTVRIMHNGKEYYVYVP